MVGEEAAGEVISQDRPHLKSRIEAETASERDLVKRNARDRRTECAKELRGKGQGWRGPGEQVGAWPDEEAGAQGRDQNVEGLEGHVKDVSLNPVRFKTQNLNFPGEGGGLGEGQLEEQRITRLLPSS